MSNLDGVVTMDFSAIDAGRILAVVQQASSQAASKPNNVLWDSRLVWQSHVEAVNKPLPLQPEDVDLARRQLKDVLRGLTPEDDQMAEEAKGAFSEEAVSRHAYSH